MKKTITGTLRVHQYKDEHVDGIQIVMPSGDELFLNKDLAEDLALMILSKLQFKVKEKE